MTALPTIKEATQLASKDQGQGVLYYEKGRHGVVWFDQELGCHTTPLSTWHKSDCRCLECTMSLVKCLQKEKACGIYNLS